jgi:hypothetical protein
MYDHSLKTTCNIRPVKLVEIFEKWESAHKKIETLQSESKMIRCNVERDFPQSSHLINQVQDDLFTSLRDRFAFLSDSASTRITQALASIETRLKPVHSTECDSFRLLSFLFNF